MEVIGTLAVSVVFYVFFISGVGAGGRRRRDGEGDKTHEGGCVVARRHVRGLHGGAGTRSRGLAHVVRSTRSATGRALEFAHEITCFPREDQ
jgi:hypothetical protein